MKTSQPWWRASHKVWYMTRFGTQHLLGNDPNFARWFAKEGDTALNRVRDKSGRINLSKLPKTVEQEFHRLMALKKSELVKPKPKVEAKPTAPKPPLTIQVLAEQYHRAMLPTWESNTEKVFVQATKFFLEQFGDVPVAEFDYPAFLTWVKSRNSWSVTYRNLVWGRCGAIFRWAYREDPPLIARDRFTGKTNPFPKTAREKIFTPEEQTKFLKACEDYPEFHLFMRALFHTGARPGEIRQLTAEHLHPTANFAIRVKSKRRLRQIPFTTLMPEIRKLAREYPTGALFRDRRGNPWVMQTYIWHFHKRRRLCGIAKGVVPYTCRHTKGTALYNNPKVSAANAALVMGHGIDVGLRHYFHGDRSHMEKAMQALDSED